MVADLGLISTCASHEVEEKRSIWFFEVCFPLMKVKRRFQFDNVCDHRLWHCLYSWTILPSEEKAVSDSHVASSIGYPFHLM